MKFIHDFASRQILSEIAGNLFYFEFLRLTALAVAVRQLNECLEAFTSELF